MCSCIIRSALLVSGCIFPSQPFVSFQPCITTTSHPAENSPSTNIHASGALLPSSHRLPLEFAALLPPEQPNKVSLRTCYLDSPINTTSNRLVSESFFQAFFQAFSKAIGKPILGYFLALVFIKVPDHFSSRVDHLSHIGRVSHRPEFPTQQ